MVAAAHLRWLVPSLLALAANAAACDGDRLGPAATNECEPLADPAVRVTSQGLTADGRYVVIVGEGSAARAFYGIPAHMVEGTIQSTKPGCALEVSFEVQGRAYVATFSPDAARCMVASTLESGNPGDAKTKVPLTVLKAGGVDVDAGDAGVTGAPLTFYCL